MDRATIDQQVRTLVERRLLRNPPDLYKYLPPILLKPNVTSFTYWADNYFILALVNNDKKRELKKNITAYGNPFPGLIKPEHLSGPVAIRVENSRNGMLDHNSTNVFFLSLGKDCTLIVRDHTQKTRTDRGVIEYFVDLAYIVSFGDEIKPYNLLNYLDDLMAYSLKQWKSGYVK